MSRSVSSLFPLLLFLFVLSSPIGWVCFICFRPFGRVCGPPQGLFARRVLIWITQVIFFGSQFALPTGLEDWPNAVYPHPRSQPSFPGIPKKDPPMIIPRGSHDPPAGLGLALSVLLYVLPYVTNSVDPANPRPVRRGVGREELLEFDPSLFPGFRLHDRTPCHLTPLLVQSHRPGHISFLFPAPLFLPPASHIPSHRCIPISDGRHSDPTFPHSRHMLSHIYAVSYAWGGIRCLYLS